MRPPECDLCGSSPGPEGHRAEGFKTLRFADYEALPEGEVGHPVGLHWLCGEHAAVATKEALTDLPWTAAAARLRTTMPRLDLEWPDGDGRSGVLLQEDGLLRWWSQPGGPNGRFGEASRDQSRGDYLANGPAVTCPPSVDAELRRVLGG